MITKAQLDEMLKNKQITVDDINIHNKNMKFSMGVRSRDATVHFYGAAHEGKNENRLLKFTVPGVPVSCPRMTQRDKWMKRPCVMKYREYSDRLRKFVNLNDLYVGKVTMRFYMPMPESWSVKKIQSMAGKIHRVKPDYDNLAKGVGDSLFVNDSMIWCATIMKYWAQPGKERTELTFEA